ncbi:ABC transporter permease [Paludibacterium sp. B53371]|uniref:ABC transporter permease n=1 Tax=Paludibacterium sp. B53371 TaxID=2806263 RepID=UPI001C05709E|nr:ABC transporter permease [Paludibacterium sp. B53371]
MAVLKRRYSPVQLGLLILLGAALLAPLLGQASTAQSGDQARYLPALLQGTNWLWLLVLIVPAWAPWRRQDGRLHLCLLLAVVLLDYAMLRLAGQTAQRLLPDDAAAGRVSLGAGFWLLQLYAVLQGRESLRQLELSRPLCWLTACLLCLPLIWLLHSGQCDQLSLLRAYRRHATTVDQALWRHLLLLLLTMLPATVLGTVLGLACDEHPRMARQLLAVLKALQTLPALAVCAVLFVLLGPGSHDAARVSIMPSLLVLLLFALPPVAQGTLAALRQIPRTARDSARGIGLTEWQCFRQVELPLGLPVYLSALRTTTLQTIGLAAVAALIGAGGLGTLLFEGLSARAVDLIGLGVLPIVLLAMLVDASFRLAISLIGVPPHD